MQQTRTPDIKLVSQLRQVNESLEQENLSLAFELAGMEAQAVHVQAVHREAEMANVWKNIVSALQLELAQSQRDKAARRRELQNFDNLVKLAEMAV